MNTSKMMQKLKKIKSHKDLFKGSSPHKQNTVFYFQKK